MKRFLSWIVLIACYLLFSVIVGLDLMLLKYIAGLFGQLTPIMKIIVILFGGSFILTLAIAPLVYGIPLTFAASEALCASKKGTRYYVVGGLIVLAVILEFVSSYLNSDFRFAIRDAIVGIYGIALIIYGKTHGKADDDTNDKSLDNEKEPREKASVERQTPHISATEEIMHSNNHREIDRTANNQNIKGELLEELANNQKTKGEILEELDRKPLKTYSLQEPFTLFSIKDVITSEKPYKYGKIKVVAYNKDYIIYEFNPITEDTKNGYLLRVEKKTNQTCYLGYSSEFICLFKENYLIQVLNTWGHTSPKLFIKNINTGSNRQKKNVFNTSLMPGGHLLTGDYVLSMTAESDKVIIRVGIYDGGFYNDDDPIKDQPTNYFLIITLENGEFVITKKYVNCMDRHLGILKNQPPFTGKQTKEQQQAFALYTKAEELAKDGKNAEAIENLEESISLDETIIGALRLLGSLYGQTGNYKKSYEAFVKLENLTINDPVTFAGLANTSFDLNNYEECLEWCEKYENICIDGKLKEIKQTSKELLIKQKSVHQSSRDSENENNSITPNKLFVELSQALALSMNKQSMIKKPELKYLQNDSGVLDTLFEIETNDRELQVIKNQSEKQYLLILAMHAFGAGAYTILMQSKFEKPVSEYGSAELTKIFYDFAKTDAYELMLKWLDVPLDSKLKQLFDQIINDCVDAHISLTNRNACENKYVKPLMQALFNGGISLMLRKE